MSASHVNQDAGYTLVELLVVMLLLGFIALAIGGGIRFGTRVWEATEDRIASDTEVVRAQTILRTVLGAALPRKEGGFATFEGTPSRVIFDVVSVPALGTAGITRVEIEIVDMGSDKRLRLRANERGGLGRREAMLMTHLDGVEFSFLDAASAVPTWLARWRDRQRLPDAVRLAAASPNQAIDWPYFVARLPIAQSAHCAFDPVSYACRDNS